MDTNVQTYADILQMEHEYRRNTVNLNASENYTSDIVGKVQGSHGARDSYHFDPPSCFIEENIEKKVDHWAFPQLSMIEELRLHVEDSFEELLGTRRIDPRPKGGQAAEIATLCGLGKRGDTIFIVDEADGGHFGLRAIAEEVGIHLEPIAFDHSTQKIDIEETMRRMRVVEGSIKGRSAGGRISALQLSQSYILREQPLQDLATHVKDEFPHVTLAIDISHTMVLHMGLKLAQPLNCGFDVIHGNTHKTFPGPQKAIIAFSDNLDIKKVKSISNYVCPILQSNCGTAEIISLGVAALEMRRHAFEYSTKILANSKMLAKNLVEQGVNVIGESFGYTETHQVWILGSGEQSLKDDYHRLLASGFRVNPAIIPFTGGRWGFRLGVQGLTRRGMEASDMAEISKLIRRAIFDRDDPDKIHIDTFALMARFPLSNLKFRLTLEEEEEIGKFLTSKDQHVIGA